jgi:hypothetical protein
MKSKRNLVCAFASLVNCNTKRTFFVDEKTANKDQNNQAENKSMVEKGIFSLGNTFAKLKQKAQSVFQKVLYFL